MRRPIARALAALAATLAATLAPQPAAAQLAGETIGAQYLFPDLASIIIDFPAAVVGAGVEFNAINQSQVDVADASLTISSVPGQGPTQLLPAAFNGYRIYDVGGTLPGFVTVTVNAATNLPGFDATRVSFDADNVFVNLQDLVLLPGEIVLLDIGFASTVPEPATVGLVATGLVVVGAAARRRRRG